MARLKFTFWVLAAVVLAGANLVYVAKAFEQAAAQAVDARLASTTTLYLSQDALFTTQRALALARAAQDPQVATALRVLKPAEMPARDQLAALGSAFGSAAASLPKLLAAPPLLVVANDAGTALQVGSADPRVSPGRDAVPITAALAALPGAVWATVDGTPYRLVAATVRDNKLEAVAAVGFPYDEAYAAALANSAGASVTAIRGDKVLASSAAQAVRADIVRAAGAPSTNRVGQARLASLGGLSLPIFTQDGRAFAAPPALAVRTMTIDGLEGGRVALAADMEASYASLGEYQVRYLPGAVGLVALAFGFLIWIGSGSKADKEEKLKAPRPLASIAPRAEEPVSSSSAEIAAALPAMPAPEASPDDFHFGSGPGPSPNAGAAAQPPAVPPPTTTSAVAPAAFHQIAPPAQAFFPVQAAAPAQAVAPPRFAAPAPQGTAAESSFAGFNPFDIPPVAPAQSPAVALPTPARSLAEPPAVGQVPEPAPFDPFAASAPAPSPEGLARGFEQDSTVVAQVPEHLIRATMRPESSRPAAPANPEESHFQEVYKEFVATRARCGESADGLTYERFSAKLRKNKDQLVGKYNCKSVRFSVYVKEGKAALKASPIKD